MIIVGCDYHRASNKLHLWIPKLGSCKNGDSASGGSGEVLPRSDSTRSQSACGYGSQWTRALV